MENIFAFIVSLFSLFVAVLFASFLSRRKAFSFLETRVGRFSTLDGLRGFLALSVFLHHFVITWQWRTTGFFERPPQDFFQNYGKVGVAIFFMITGFLFTAKILNDQGKTNWYKLFESRVYRIFPLYIFAVTIITVIVFYSANFEINVDYFKIFKQYVRWGLFHGADINDFKDTNLIIAGVDWTLKYEWVFYLSLPILAFIIYRGGVAGVSVLLVSCVIFFFRPLDFISVSTEYCILFAVGGVSAFMYRNYDVSHFPVRSRWVSYLTLFLVFAILFYPKTLDFFHVVLISIFFILVVFGNDLFGLFSLKSSALLGEVSYSIYLLHGAILYIIFTMIQVPDIRNFSFDSYLYLMPVITIIVVTVSCVTFLLIEKPGISFGRKYLFAKLLTSSSRDKSDQPLRIRN